MQALYVLQILGRMHKFNHGLDIFLQTRINIDWYFDAVECYKTAYIELTYLMLDVFAYSFLDGLGLGQRLDRTFDLCHIS